MPNPDEQHKDYYSKNPNGNHTMPSPETLRFMEKQEKINEKIMEGLSDIKTHLAKHDEKLESILAQTTKTNGRVNELESWKSNNNEYIQDCKERRRANQNRLWDYVWKIGLGLVLLLLSMASIDDLISLLK